MSPPRVQFLIGGVQKAGTTALANYLRAHPRLRLPLSKEAHVFDAPSFNDAMTAQQVDARFEPHFLGKDWASREGLLFGDATPIYIMHSLLVQRIWQYNPAMQWVLLIRDPAERAYSQYMMELARGTEQWPFWPAMLLEPLRLWRHAGDFSTASPLRTCSYRLRGDYPRQLSNLLRYFPSRQVLLLDSEELASRPEATLARVTSFLGVDPVAGMQPARHFEGDYRPLSARPLRRFFLQLLMWRERRGYNRLQRMLKFRESGQAAAPHWSAVNTEEAHID